MRFDEVQAANESRARRWHPDGLDSWSHLEWAGAMCGEAGEAANVAKKLKRIGDGIVGTDAAERDALLAAYGEEVADTVTYAFCAASAAGVDLGEAVRRKFNAVSERLGFPERLGEADAELHWLTFFAQEADFGPADSDVRASIKARYRAQHGPLPPGWDCCDNCGEEPDDCSCGEG